MRIKQVATVRSIIQTEQFARDWDRLGFDDEDLRLLELDIMKHPDKYSIMQSTGGLRKARVALENQESD